MSLLHPTPTLPTLLAGALRERLPRVLLLFVALGLLRLEHMGDRGLTLAEAWHHSLATGFANDLMLTLLVELAVVAVGVVRPRWAGWLWAPLALGLVGASVTNLLYFKFFDAPLQLWVLRSHYDDVLVNTGSASRLGASAYVYGALALLFAGAIASVRARPAARSWAAHAVSLALVAAGLVAAQTAKAVVRNPAVIEQRSGRLAGHIVFDWLKEVRGRHVSDEWFQAQQEVSAGLLRMQAERQGVRPATTLAAFRDLGRAPAEPPDDEWPLWMPLEADHDDSAAWRERLGLPADGPINVYVFFLESTRAYEFFHPQIGPSVFPHLGALFERRGLVFPQTYTSSAEAGLTARGRFSTTCSMLPGIGGPAPTIALPHLGVTCLPELLREQGYETLWVSAYKRAYHNAYSFESAHGTQRFYDVQTFRERGVTQNIGQWGMADAPYLAEAAKVLAEVNAEGAPVYAAVINLSTHHPHSVIDEGPLDEAMLRLTEGHEDYRGYLSRLRYSQEAAARFIDEVLAAPGGERSLFVVLGDHSITVPTAHALEPAQKSELLFRVPMAFVTRDLPQPGRIDRPVHQIDVAPMLARVLGLDGQTTWLGRASALDGDGSAFVFRSTSGLHYRAGDRLCHAQFEGEPPLCWHVPEGVDPLFAPGLNVVAEDAEQSAFFARVVEAGRQAVVLDALRPPEEAHEVLAGAGE